MKICISMILLFGSIVFAKSADRSPNQFCASKPTIRCREDFHPAKNEQGCFVCVADQDDEDRELNCVTKPAILCKKGFEISRTAVGCYVCVPSKPRTTVTDGGETCIKKPTVTCASGSHVAKNKQGCFYCIRESDEDAHGEH